MYQPPKPKKKLTAKGIVIIVAIVIVAIIGNIYAYSLTRSNTDAVATPIATQPPAPTFTATPTPAPTKHFKQTEAVEVTGLWDIEIVSVKTSTGSEFNQPQKSGNVFLVFLVKVKNISSQEQNISSLGQFSLLDSTGQKYDETIDSDAGASLDGKVEPSSLLQGSIAFEVPASMKTFTFNFEPQMFVQGEVIWDIQL